MARKPRTPRVPRSLSSSDASPSAATPLYNTSNSRDSVPTADLSADNDVFILSDNSVVSSEPDYSAVNDAIAVSSDNSGAIENDSLLARVMKRTGTPDANADEISHLRRRHQASRRRSRRVRAFVVALIALVLAGGVYAIFFSALFSLSLANIVVTHPDDSPIDEGSIRSSVSQYEGVSLLRLSLKDIAHHVENEVAGTDTVQVHRVFPHGLSITYSLAQPYACLVEGRTCVPIDDTGRRIPENPTMNIDSVIHISYKGATGDVAQAVEHAREVLNAIGETSDEILHTITRCDIDRNDSIQLVLADGRVAVWGQSEDNQKKAEVLSVLLAEPGSSFDVSVPDAPVKH